MIKVYRAQNPTEAHIVCGLLQNSGIAAVVEGQYLQGGMGELPPMDYAAVSVPEQDAAAARELIQAYERGELLTEENIDNNFDAQGDQ